MIRENQKNERIGIQALEAGDCIGWEQRTQTFSVWRYDDSQQLLKWDDGDNKNLQHLDLKQADDILRLLPQVLGLRSEPVEHQFPAYDVAILLLPKERPVVLEVQAGTRPTALLEVIEERLQ